MRFKSVRTQRGVTNHGFLVFQSTKVYLKRPVILRDAMYYGFRVVQS